MTLPYLLKAAQIAAMPWQEQVHGLNPNAVRCKRDLGAATGLTGLGIHMWEVAPGRENTAFHRHHHEDEAVFIVSGTGHAQIGERQVEVATGDFLGYPKLGPAHSLTATGQEPLVTLVMGERQAFDVCDYPGQGTRVFWAGSLEQSVERPALQKNQRPTKSNPLVIETTRPLGNRVNY